MPAGGVENARVFTHIWLALFGLWPWEEVPALPPELIYLPPWFPLNIYDFACWARQTIAALTIVRAERPVRPIGIDLDEIFTGRPVKPTPRTFRGRVLLWLDAVARLYERRPLKLLRRRATARVERWVLDRQEVDGSWGGIQPPWVYSLMALSVVGHTVDDPAMRKGLEGIEGFLINEGSIRRLEACQSPVWDTALAIIALTDAGVAADDPAVVKAADWMLAEEIRIKGDWAVRRPDLEPGGWAFEFDNDNYPDIDDTAEVVLALRRARVSVPDARRKAAIARGLTWITGMASSDGGWAAFDADNTSRLVAKLPFCDFGAVTDPPSADVTAHVVEALAAMGQAGSRAARRGVVWLLRAQESDGSWFGRWGANYVYGTGAVVPALIAAGVQPGKPAIRRAVAWLEQHQNPDGGWGEDMRSYDDPSLAGHGASTASQTAWALLALLAAGAAEPAVEAGARWLAEHQRSDGTWDEPQFTGTGFPRDFYLNYHLYRLVFPVSALGRYLSSPASSSPAPGDGSAAALPPPGTA